MTLLIALIVCLVVFGIPLTLMALGALSKWRLKNPKEASDLKGVTAP